MMLSHSVLEMNIVPGTSTEGSCKYASVLLSRDVLLRGVC